MDFIGNLEAAMMDAGISIIGHINPHSNKFQRFRKVDAPRKGFDIFVKILDGGAVFGDWHHPDNWITWWEKSYSMLSREERIRRQLQIETAKNKSLLERQHAMSRAKLLWNHPALREASLSQPYVKLKGIVPYYARQWKSRLILPVRDIYGDIISLQFIYSDCKRKRFKKDATYRGGFMLLGEQILPHDTVRICEGWATACSIYEAVGAPVVCAFNADNLVNVSILLRRKYVFSSFQICADNDIHLKENIGLKYGREAAKLIGASLHYPIFSEGISGKLTDFNDLFCHAGIEEVERQIIIVRP